MSARGRATAVRLDDLHSRRAETCSGAIRARRRQNRDDPLPSFIVRSTRWTTKEGRGLARSRAVKSLGQPERNIAGFEPLRVSWRALSRASPTQRGWYVNLCPPSDASAIKPFSSVVTTATPFV